MMITRTAQSSRACRDAMKGCVRRCQSTAATTGGSGLKSPSPKICSVPFRQTPQSALEKMHLHALLAAPTISNLAYAFLLRIFGPSVTSLVREFGMGENVKLKDMKAALYPIWRVDLMMEGKVEQARNRRASSGWIGIKEGYVPGNPFAPLSYLSFAVPPLPDELPAYDPQDDLKQLGDGFDVVPVPFTVSPFGLMSKLRKTIGRMTWEGLKIDESKWKETMLAAYPIMFPIYLAEFEHTSKDEGKRSYTVVMDAHDAAAGKCRLSWPPPPEIVEHGRFTSNYYINPAPFLPNVQLTMPIAPIAIGAGTTGEQIVLTGRMLADKYMEWMSPPPKSTRSIAASPLLDLDPEDQGINWEDARILSWGGKEREENDEYMEKSANVHKGIGALQGLADLTSQLPEGDDPQGVVVSMSAGKNLLEKKPMSEIRAQMSKDVEQSKAQLIEFKPSWLREWEAAQARSTSQQSKSA